MGSLKDPPPTRPVVGTSDGASCTPAQPLINPGLDSAWAQV